MRTFRVKAVIQRFAENAIAKRNLARAVIDLSKDVYPPTEATVVENNVVRVHTIFDLHGTPLGWVFISDCIARAKSHTPNYYIMGSNGNTCPCYNYPDLPPIYVPT
jgi:hypothetical protein